MKLSRRKFAWHSASAIAASATLSANAASSTARRKPLNACDDIAQRKLAALNARLHPLAPIRSSFHLRVSAKHELYVEESGNPRGIPVVLVHGGPGGPWSRESFRFFDPKVFRLIGFDQRGAYRSHPLGLLEENTTTDLVNDMERIREHLGVDRWLVFGGSWGTAVSLHYAQSFPARCLAMVLRAVMTGQPGFDRWDFEGSRMLFPESFERLETECPIQLGQSSAPLWDRYYDALLSSDNALTKKAMDAWYRHSDVMSNSNALQIKTASEGFTPAMELAGARLSAHYWRNQIFLPPKALLDRADRMKGIPGLIVHGRNDYNCLIGDAFAIHRRWPDSKFVAVPNAGHSQFELGMAEALFEGIAKLQVQIAANLRRS
jgi:proline iminopeptidase